MKKNLLSLIAVMLTLAAAAQCDKLFLSEYLVGTGNNKGFEIYNPTDAPIDLDGYMMERWSNGQNSASDTTILAGTIPAHGTWVVVNGQTEDIDLGTFISPRCDSVMQSLADQLDSPYPAPTFMNGNDALVFVDHNGGGTEVLDIFGKPGEDPGTAWAAPDGTFITNSQTMVRKFEVTEGVTVPPITFYPMEQYDTLGTDNWSNLGIHNCECFPLGVDQRKPLDVKMFPNPVENGNMLNVRTNRAIEGVEVIDVRGRVVSKQITLINATEGLIDMGNMPAGTYVVNILMEASGFSTQIIKK